MPRRKLTYLAAAAAVVLAGAFGATAASAAPSSPSAPAVVDVLTVGSLGGTNVTPGSPGDTLTAVLIAGGSFTTPAGNISCTQGNFAATVNTNPPAPGSATETVTVLHFVPTTCTDTIAGTSGVVSIDLKVNGAASAVDGTSPQLNVTSLDEKVVLKTSLGNLVCDYGTAGAVTQISGSLSNTTGNVTFSSAPVARVSGTATCPATGTFTATFGPILDQSKANQRVYIN